MKVTQWHTKKPHWWYYGFMDQQGCCQICRSLPRRADLRVVLHNCYMITQVLDRVNSMVRIIGDVEHKLWAFSGIVFENSMKVQDGYLSTANGSA